MSLVINVVTLTRSFTISDGRARNSKTGVIVSETLPKLEKLTPSVTIGFTGTLEPAREVIARFRALPNAAELKYSDEIAPVIFGLASRLPGSAPLQLLVTGPASCGSMATFTANSEEAYRVTELYPKPDSPSYAVLGTGHGSASLVKSLCLLLAFSNRDPDKIPQQSIFSTMQEYLVRISECDSSVNRNIYRDYLELP